MSVLHMNTWAPVSANPALEQILLEIIVKRVQVLHCPPGWAGQCGSTRMLILWRNGWKSNQIGKIKNFTTTVLFILLNTADFKLQYLSACWHAPSLLHPQGNEYIKSVDPYCPKWFCESCWICVWWLSGLKYDWIESQTAPKWMVLCTREWLCARVH